MEPVQHLCQGKCYTNQPHKPHPPNSPLATPCQLILNSTPREKSWIFLDNRTEVLHTNIYEVILDQTLPLSLFKATLHQRPRSCANKLRDFETRAEHICHTLHKMDLVSYSGCQHRYSGRHLNQLSVDIKKLGSGQVSIIVLPPHWPIIGGQSSVNHHRDSVTSVWAIYQGTIRQVSVVHTTFLQATRPCRLLDC